MYTYVTEKRVRYSETDKMGYLYYGRYAELYEIGRVEWLRSLGLTYREMEDVHGIMLPVLAVESKFLLPAYYDENLKIKTTIKQMPTKMLIFNHQVHNEENILIHKALVKLFFVNMDTNKRVSIPSFLAEKLQPYFLLNG